MGNYFSAWEAMIDRLITMSSYYFVHTYDHPAISYNHQRNKEDGAGLSWDINQLSNLNELEFCSMIGHDSDVRVFLYPIIEERIAVIKETRERAEFEWKPEDEAEFQMLTQQEIFELWELWRMCHDDANSFATTRAEMCNNFGLAGFDGDVTYILELFEPTQQRDLVHSVTFMNEAIGFREFAIRIYSFMYGQPDEYKAGHEEKSYQLTDVGPVDGMFLRERRKSREKRQCAMRDLKSSFHLLFHDLRMRRQGVPYRCRAMFHMF